MFIAHELHERRKRAYTNQAFLLGFEQRCLSLQTRYKWHIVFSRSNPSLVYRVSNRSL